MVPHSLMALVYTLVPSLQSSFPKTEFHPRAMNNAFTKFADPLPIPKHIVAQSQANGQPVELHLKLSQFNTKIHANLPVQPVWGYAGSFPGPVIDVEKDQLVRIHWENTLPSKHLFPAPKLDLMVSLGLCEPTTPDVRSVTHLHGAEVQATDPNDHVHNNDGWPDAFTLPGGEQIAEYPNHQEARTMWYHDHAMATTGRNVAAGLAGFYMIHDAYERSLQLPSGRFEIPLMFRSETINDDGVLEYTNDPGIEYYGNTVSVNGKLWPTLAVEPRKYRFRMVDGSNARSYEFKLLDATNGSDGPVINQIGSDSGFLENTVVFNDPNKRLTMAPGERADVIIDFSKFAGKTLLLHNTSRDAGDGEIAMPEIMHFQVSTKLSGPDTSKLPMKMRPIARLQPNRLKKDPATGERTIVFAESTAPSGDTMLTLNGKIWHAPVEEKPLLGSTEIWNLTNTLNDVHPFHIHLVQFQILDRTPFDADQFLKTGKIVWTGPSVLPDANEMGWKDTVRLQGYAVTRIIMRFLPYPGYYVYHCHILEHEDMDMMRPFQVVAPTRAH